MFYLRFQKILDYMFFNIKGYQRVTFSSFSFLSFYSIFLQSLLILCPPFHMISSNNSITITQFLTIVYLVFSCHNNKVVFFRHLFKRFHNTNLTALIFVLKSNRAPLIKRLFPHMMGGPFYTSVPSGRVGMSKVKCLRIRACTHECSYAAIT